MDICSKRKIPLHIGSVFIANCHSCLPIQSYACTQFNFKFDRKITTEIIASIYGDQLQWIPSLIWLFEKPSIHKRTADGPPNCVSRPKNGFQGHLWFQDIFAISNHTSVRITRMEIAVKQFAWLTWWRAHPETFPRTSSLSLAQCPRDLFRPPRTQPGLPRGRACTKTPRKASIFPSLSRLSCQQWLSFVFHCCWDPYTTTLMRHHHFTVEKFNLGGFFLI